MSPSIEALHDSTTATVTYVVYDAPGGYAAIIDPVLDYDPKASRTGTAAAERVLDCLRRHDLRVAWILETHAHADHLSAAQWLKARVGGTVAIGEHIRDVQRAFGVLYHLGDTAPADGAPFDHLFRDGDTFSIGALTACALHVPGHTPADIAYRIGDAVFVGDTLFMPDVGTARCDFPGGDAHRLYRSIRRLLALPGDTRLFMCHDYPPPGRDAAWETTVSAQRLGNIHVRDGIGEDDFVHMRTARDRTLDMPALIWPSVQVNIRAGQLPAAESNGMRYLKIPLDAS
ncbi:MAG: MBL fold metallo-hydrolase [Microvirgula sp.]